MALVTTAGASDADSFASLAAADTYATAHGLTDWSGTDTAKEQALRRATAWLDGAFASRWPGVRTHGREQALGWPRGDAEDRDGWAIDATTIPPEVERATIEAAVRELADPGSLSPDVTPGTAKMLTGVGDLTWTPLRQQADAADMAPVLLAVERILAPILRAGRSSVEVVRA